MNKMIIISQSMTAVIHFGITVHTDQPLDTASKFPIMIRKMAMKLSVPGLYEVLI